MKLKQIIKNTTKKILHSNLNPRYGLDWLWIKNTTINSYKYPLKNQEDEVIQLDKINQNQFFTY
jgi:hypothetical protein